MIFCAISISTFAKDIYEAQNGDTISATISSSSLTRIEIKGQKIIKDFTSADVIKKITKPLGQIYLIPNTQSIFTLYIVSDSGNTYNLRLTPSKNVYGDSIVIKPATANVKTINPISFANQPYVRNINYLLETMYLNKDNDSQYNTTITNQAIITYSGLDSVLFKEYSNGTLLGQVLLVKNISRSKILLTEAQFYSEHTLAVTIENPELNVNDITRIFIVKEDSNE